MLQDAEQERYAVKQDLIKLSSRQSEVAARMRAFLMAEMEVLAQFQGDDPSGFIRLVSAHEPGRMAMLSEPASEFGTPDVSASERVSSDTPEEQAADEAKLDSKEEPQEPIATATDPSEPPPVEEPATIVEPPLDEEPTVATERPPIEQPPAAVKPPPIPSAEQRASEPPVPTEVVDVPDGEPSLSRHPIPADSLPIPAPEDPPLTPELVSPVVPPPPAPVPYPVEEPAILAPIPEPAGLPSVEELIAETPSLSQAETAEVDPRPTYRDMLSGTQSAPPTELAEDPFSSSFFESPFPGDEKLGEAHVQAPKPVPGSDSAQQWSLRSVVKGDGDSEPTSSSPSDAERERIRRILEDLD